MRTASLLFTFTSVLNVLAQDLAGGLRLASIPSTLLKPLINKPVESNKGIAARENRLSGLLVARACTSGYGLCSNTGVCCPLQGDCCSDGGCCKAGNWCYAGGCCPDNDFGCEQNSCCPQSSTCCTGGGCCPQGQYCAVADGQRGCCDNGQVCTGGPSGQCADAGYVPCVSYDFCCPTGYTCHESGGDQKCRAPGSVNTSPTTHPSATPTHSPTPTASHTTPTSGTSAAPSSPSLDPTDIPSDVPSDTPTDIPTSQVIFSSSPQQASSAKQTVLPSSGLPSNSTGTSSAHPTDTSVVGNNNFSPAQAVSAPSMWVMLAMSIPSLLAGLRAFN